jgi:hypothetical protein
VVSADYHGAGLAAGNARDHVAVGTLDCHAPHARGAQPAHDEANLAPARRRAGGAGPDRHLRPQVAKRAPCIEIARRQLWGVRLATADASGKAAQSSHGGREQGDVSGGRLRNGRLG